MKYREGWRPRALSTIPNVTHYTRGMSTQGQEVARVGSLVLCEMPERVAKQRDAHYAGLAKSQNVSVSKKDDEAAGSAGQAHGFSKINHSDEVTTSRGRVPPPMTQ